MLVVDRYELAGHLVGIAFLLIVRDKCVDEALAAVTVGHGSDQILAKLLGSFGDGVLHQVAVAHELQQRANVGFFCGIDRRGGSRSGGRARMCGPYRRLRGSQDDHEKCSHVDEQQRQNRLHDFLRERGLPSSAPLCHCRQRAGLSGPARRTGVPRHPPSVRTGSKSPLARRSAALPCNARGGPLSRPRARGRAARLCCSFSFRYATLCGVRPDSAPATFGKRQTWMNCSNGAASFLFSTAPPISSAIRSAPCPRASTTACGPTRIVGPSAACAPGKKAGGKWPSAWATKSRRSSALRRVKFRSTRT